jgi:hypothetical protein
MSADLSSILQTMVANPGEGMSAAARQALFSQFAEDDPTVNLLATYLSQRDSNGNGGADADTASAKEGAACAAELDRAREQSEKSAAAVRELRDRIEKLFAELETLRERNDSLAQALGACALCWGGDVECPICGGEGQSGFTIPDQRLFAQLIGPAVSRLRKRNAGLPPFRSTGALAPNGY